MLYKKTTYTRTCIICQKEFEAYRPNSNYCSNQCYKEKTRRYHEQYDRRKRELKKINKPKAFRNCAICGKEFELLHHSTKYCSNECRKELINRNKPKHNEYQRKKRTRINLKIKECVICGTLFNTTDGRRKYCSDKCIVEGMRITTARYLFKKYTDILNFVK